MRQMHTRHASQSSSSQVRAPSDVTNSLPCKQLPCRPLNSLLQYPAPLSYSTHPQRSEESGKVLDERERKRGEGKRDRGTSPRVAHAAGKSRAKPSAMASQPAASIASVPQNSTPERTPPWPHTSILRRTPPWPGLAGEAQDEQSEGLSLRLDPLLVRCGTARRKGWGLTVAPSASLLHEAAALARPP